MSRIHHATTAERWFFLAWLLVSLWILACALLVQGEYGDGYQTIVNGRYFFGDAPKYYVQRGPLAALAMFPVELLRSWIGWNPVDVRPYHIYSGLLHSLYLLGCWLLIKRCGDNRRAQIIAFVAAILSLVFYANAPHLSHDIIPGLLFLLMIFICNRWLNMPGVGLATQLVLLGAAVTFIKQTYALFWLALVVFALVSLLLRWDKGRVTARKALVLLGLAGISGIISWFGYSLFIVNDLAGATLLTGPIDLMNAVANQYGDSFEEIFTTDLYLLNIHNYGIAAMLLALPGLALALRGNDPRLRMIAVCWLLSVIVMQSVKYREVRYLAFLAPLTACMIVPVVQALLRHRVAASLLVLLLLFDQYRGLTVSAAQLSSTAGVNIDRFLSAPEGDGRVVCSRTLSFVYMPASPMPHDPYHGIYHISAKLYDRLLEGQVEVVELDDPRDLGQVGVVPGDRVLYSNRVILRKMPWQEDNVPAALAEFVQVAGNVREYRLLRQGEQFVVDNGTGSWIMFVPDPTVGPAMPLVSSTGLQTQDIQAIFGAAADSAELQVLGVAIKALCLGERCIYE